MVSDRLKTLKWASKGSQNKTLPAPIEEKTNFTGHPNGSEQTPPEERCSRRQRQVSASKVDTGRTLYPKGRLVWGNLERRLRV